MRTCCSSNRPPWQAPTTSTSTPCSLNIRRLVQNCRLSNATPRKGKPMMSAQLNDPFTPELQDVLSNLAAGLFGFDAWIKQPGKYKPPLPDEDLPWRAAGHTFSPSDLGVIPFFEALLASIAGYGGDAPKDGSSGLWQAGKRPRHRSGPGVAESV